MLVILSHNHKLRNLIAESWLEIVFAARPTGFKAPNYKIYMYEHSEGLAVVWRPDSLNGSFLHTVISMY